MNSLVKANRQLLAILKEHLQYLQKMEEFSADTKKIPSEGQAYFYRSSANLGPADVAPLGSTTSSFVRTEQDSAFVVTDIYVTGAYRRKPFVPDWSYAFPLFLKFTNSSNGRSLTISKDNVYYDVNNILFTDFGIPSTAFTPPGAGGIINFDYHYQLPCEYLLPRGAVVRGDLQEPDGLGKPSYASALDFVLGGYKVFGA